VDQQAVAMIMVWSLWSSDTGKSAWANEVWGSRWMGWHGRTAINGFDSEI